MTERKGSRVQWKAECGHWMVAYSLEPTPPQCPDCADKYRTDLEDVLKRWKSDIGDALSHAEDCGVEDVAEWLREDGTEVSDDDARALQIVADRCGDAMADLEGAEMALRKFIAKLPPKAERLTMDSA